MKSKILIALAVFSLISMISIVAFADGGSTGSVTSTQSASSVTNATYQNAPTPSGSGIQVSAFKVGAGNYNINGTEVQDVAPYISDGHVLLPIRYVMYSIGYDDTHIAWNQETNTVTITGKRLSMLKKTPSNVPDDIRNNIEDVTAIITLGSKIMTVNGKEIELDAAPENNGGRLMFPLRAIAETFNCAVVWVDDLKTAFIGAQNMQELKQGIMPKANSGSVQ